MTTSFTLSNEQLQKLIDVVKEADAAILNIYNSPFTVEEKSDNSPLTEADKASHAIITAGLAKLFPDIPVISEEGDIVENEATLKTERFWLIDPLDGTKEFIHKNGEFTICIALIENARPTFGIISVPTKQTVYYGGVHQPAMKQVGSSPAEPIHVASTPTNVVSVSKSHLSDATKGYVARNFPTAKMVQAGSSLKAAMVAEGLVDANPTLDSGGMSLWDVAASHAIVEAAGGTVSRPNGDSITYSGPSLRIGDFVISR